MAIQITVTKPTKEEVSLSVEPEATFGDVLNKLDITGYALGVRGCKRANKDTLASAGVVSGDALYCCARISAAAQALRRVERGVAQTSTKHDLQQATGVIVGAVESSGEQVNTRLDALQFEVADLRRGRVPPRDPQQSREERKRELDDGIAAQQRERKAIKEEEKQEAMVERAAKAKAKAEAKAAKAKAKGKAKAAGIKPLVDYFPPAGGANQPAAADAEATSDAAPSSAERHTRRRIQPTPLEQSKEESKEEPKDDDMDGFIVDDGANMDPEAAAGLQEFCDEARKGKLGAAGN